VRAGPSTLAAKRVTIEFGLGEMLCHKKQMTLQ
jgi:hypothetical protein